MKPRLVALASVAVALLLPVARVSAERAITSKTLLANEEYWPYIVALVAPLAVDGRDQPIRPETRGVLIRVLPDERVRIDFSEHGVHEVPLRLTNAVTAANGARRGRLHKLGPNLSAAVGTKLGDSTSPEPRPFPRLGVADAPRALLVFADPEGRRFGDVARTLAPLSQRKDVLTIVFPQSGRSDGEVRARLRGEGWTVPFVLARYAKAYTRAQLGENEPMPALLLVTNEGRLLFEATWSPDVMTRLQPALEAAARDDAE